MTPKPSPQLRRHNQIKTIQGSLEIEGNSLNLDQVTDILEGKRVLGPKKEILEVQNAIKAYDQIERFNIFQPPSLCKAHRILMEGLIPNPGKWRTSQVGILQGSQVAHIAPKANQVPSLMNDLFDHLKLEFKKNALIVSCLFHYEFEFIHPFMDGNGRAGRLWQHAILIKHHPLFSYLPIESVIRDRQKQYYKVLGESDKKGESTPFIEFCLEAIADGLEELLNELKPEPLTTESRLEIAKFQFKQKWFSRKDYLSFFKTISTATASRDLLQGTQSKALTKRGEKALTEYKF